MSKEHRFDSIEQLRSRQRDIAASAVGEVRKAIELVDERIREIESEIASLTSERQSNSNGQVAVQSLMEVQRYHLVLLGQIQHLNGQRETLLAEQQRREAVLVKSQQSLKSLQKLSEKYREEAIAIEATRFQSRLDEWSNTQAVVKGAILKGNSSLT